MLLSCCTVFQKMVGRENLFFYFFANFLACRNFDLLNKWQKKSPTFGAQVKN
jgi:hypothetical protein